MITRFALVLALCASIAACSTSSNGKPAASPLVQALSHVVDNANTRSSIMYGRPRAGLAATGGTTGSPYQPATAFYVDNYQYATQIRSTLGIDLTSAETAVEAGRPPNTGSWLTKVDLARFGAAATGLGATKSAAGSTTTYRFRPDFQQSFTDRLGKALPGVLNRFDVVSADGANLRYAPSKAALHAVDASSGRTLADEASVLDVAECLGAPLAAQLVDAAHAGSSLPSFVTEVGAALSGSQDVRPTETLCVATRSDKDATQLAAVIRLAVTSGRSARTGVAWSKFISGAQVSVAGGAAHVVKLTAHPVHPSGGVLLQSLQIGDIGGLLTP